MTVVNLYTRGSACIAVVSDHFWFVFGPMRILHCIATPSNFCQFFRSGGGPCFHLWHLRTMANRYCQRIHGASCRNGAAPGQRSVVVCAHDRARRDTSVSPCSKLPLRLRTRFGFLLVNSGKTTADSLTSSETTPLASSQTTLLISGSPSYAPRSSSSISLLVHVSHLCRNIGP
jgi:hypothetical protein